MKIALLNLPFDNNYGGNLQRYALIKVLQDKEHEVEHINLQCSHSLPWYKWPYSYPKRFVKRYLLGQKEVDIFMEKHQKNIRKKMNVNALRFYKQYIPHTKEVETVGQIRQVIMDRRYDTVIVGSDQVWRKAMTHSIGHESFFLKFVGDKTLKIAYSVSFGSSHCEYTRQEVKKIKELYSRFAAVSVREKSALDILSNNEWNTPKAEWTLDPTLLLTQVDYNILIEKSKTEDFTKGKIFCYALDMNDKVRKELGLYDLDYIINDLHNSDKVSIEQWLNNIKQSKMVVTDSYHGVVFSIIFNKPFKFMGNTRRGNDRIDSLYYMLGIDENNTLDCDWNIVNGRIIELREKSLTFLFSVLKSK